MDAAGVSLSAVDGDDLLRVLDRVTTLEGPKLRAAAHQMFVSDAADDVERMAGLELVSPAVASRARPRRVRLAGAAVGIAVTYTALTTGVSAATARGFGVVNKQRHSQVVYVTVRVGGRQLATPGLAAQLTSMHATAIVDANTARQESVAVRNLVVSGVEVANGGWDTRDRMAVYRTGDDLVRSSRALARITGAPVRAYVPRRNVDGFDLTTARLAHERIVLTEDVDPDSEGPLVLKPGHIYEIDGRALDPAALDGELRRLAGALDAARLEPAALQTLL
jgi:hypothetical protein